MEKIKIGQIDSTKERRRILSIIGSMQDVISGRNTCGHSLSSYVGSDLTTKDFENIKNGDVGYISEMYQKRLYEKRDAILNYWEREKYTEDIPLILNDFKEGVLRRNSQCLNTLPDYIPFDVLNFYFEGHKYDVRADNDRIESLIEEECAIYVKSEKEKEVYNLANDLIEKIKNFKGLLRSYGIELHQVPITHFISENNAGEINLNIQGLNNILTKIQKK